MKGSALNLDYCPTGKYLEAGARCWEYLEHKLISNKKGLCSGVNVGVTLKFNSLEASYGKYDEVLKKGAPRELLAKRNLNVRFWFPFEDENEDQAIANLKSSNVSFDGIPKIDIYFIFFKTKISLIFSVLSQKWQSTAQGVLQSAHNIVSLLVGAF